MICINCGAPVYIDTDDWFEEVRHVDGTYLCRRFVSELWLDPPNPDTILTFDEAEAAGVDGTLRWPGY